MPVQRTLCGRPVSLRAPPRRIQLVLSAFAFITVILLLFGPPAEVPQIPTTAAEIQEAITSTKLPKLSSVYNPFGPAVHKPPVQANSTAGGSSWLADWRWRNPFSSSITLDENRALLPPLKTRPPVYTYYEPSSKDEAVREAENRLLLAWRRAWWAQGFKPQVLGTKEALANPLAQAVQQKQLKGGIENEMMRWLAWGYMGSGILANWLALPMAPREDRMLSFLRRGEYPLLTVWKDLETSVVVGEKEAINNVIKKALENAKLADCTNMITAVKDAQDAGKEDSRDATATFTVDTDDKLGVAHYSFNTLLTKYKDIYKKFEAKEDAKGLALLAQLINAHLHTTWQNTFTSGVNIIKPAPTHMTVLTRPAVDLARNLTQCPASPLPASCPPNNAKCTPCAPTHPLPMQVLPVYRNKTSLYNIGTVPHPYTFASLVHQKDAIDFKFIRREIKDRDQWLAASTKECLGTAVSSASRAVSFKDAVASDFGASHTIWLTAERETHEDLDWIFGFEIPRESAQDGKSETPVPGPERRPPPPKLEGKQPTELELTDEEKLLRKARDVVKSEVRELVRVREAMEAWNLADTEAWRFARAYSARRRVERLVWEEEEKKFAGAEKAARKSALTRWFD